MARAKEAAAKKAGTAVVPKGSDKTAVQAASMEEMYLQDAGQGLENARAEDFALPFIYLLQDGSPEVQKRSERYIEDAEAGQFMNTVSRFIYGRQIRVIPVQFDKVYNEWIPRDQGGGFIASHKTKEEAAKSKQEDTQIVDTANHYVLIEEEDGTWQPAILSLTSTKLKASRNWLSRIAQRTINGPDGRVSAPSFSAIYEVSSIEESKKGNDYFNVRIEPVEGEDGWVSDPAVYQQAKNFRASLLAGRVGADFTKVTAEEVEAEVSDDDRPSF